MLIELNLRYPGGLAAVRQAFYQLWASFVEQGRGFMAGRTPPRPARSSPRYRRGSRWSPPSSISASCPGPMRRRWSGKTAGRPGRAGAHRSSSGSGRTTHLEPQIDRSAPTVKADAAWRSYDARGRGIVWAVIDSGIDACHPHFSALELATEGRGDMPRRRA